MLERRPPDTTDPDMVAYLEQMFEEVALEIRNSGKFARRDKLPQDPEIGRMYYFNAAIPTTAITSEGWWGYKSTGWVNIA